jgi:hypothetical protein
MLRWQRSFASSIVKLSKSNTSIGRGALSAAQISFTPLNGVNVYSASGVFPGTLATPLPAALPLFASGLGGLGLFGWRRKRRAQATA